jgi:hypothetical protein
MARAASRPVFSGDTRLQAPTTLGEPYGVSHWIPIRAVQVVQRFQKSRICARCCGDRRRGNWTLSNGGHQRADQGNGEAERKPRAGPPAAARRRLVAQKPNVPPARSMPPYPPTNPISGRRPRGQTPPSIKAARSPGW